jgi:hypothetical protein
MMASVKKPLRLLEYSEMKIYSDSLVGESRDSHMSYMMTACEAGCQDLFI